MSAKLHIYADAAALTHGAAEAIASGLSHAIEKTGRASIALSGGSTPRSVYELLATKILAWNKVHVFWGDERCVHSDSPESNFRMTRTALLEKVPIPQSNIHRVMTELSPADAASEYESELKEHFHPHAPVFDIFLLGLGEDGHTASLFPETSAISERKRSVVEVFVPHLASHRVTMTFPVINNSRNVMFLVSGKSKAGIVREILEGPKGLHPAASVRPAEGPAWLLDASSASLLSTKETA